MGAPAQGGQQVTPNQSGMSATGAPVAQGAIGGPSNIMPNGMSSGDVIDPRNAFISRPTLLPGIKSSGQNFASLSNSSGEPNAVPLPGPGVSAGKGGTSTATPAAAGA